MIHGTITTTTTTKTTTKAITTTTITTKTITTKRQTMKATQLDLEFLKRLKRESSYERRSPSEVS